MYGILGEDESDVETLTILVRRLAGDDKLPIKRKGYGGSGELLRKGSKQLLAFHRLKCERFIVCHDADGPDPQPKANLVLDRVVRPSRLRDLCCILVPVQELEAWILADIECATAVFSSWKPRPVAQPESIASPKEYLEKLSRQSNQQPRYRHSLHNPVMAKHLCLTKVSEKCPSFRVLENFVK